MKTHSLVHKTIIKRPIGEVFDFFSNAENLNLITPPDFNFKILTPLPIQMAAGTRIDYSINFKGIPFKWKTEISAWKTNQYFIDKQVSGPYKIWEHLHLFNAVEEGTEMIDKLSYLSRGWIVEPFLQLAFVKRNVEAIFDYRNQKLKELFPA